MSEENDILYFNGSKTFTSEDMRKIGALCDAMHDQEAERLKAKFLELAESASEEKIYELLYYRRYNYHIEIIVRVDSDMSGDELISMVFFGKDWSYLQGHCSSESFEHIMEAVDDLWNNIKDYVQKQVSDYGMEETEE